MRAVVLAFRLFACQMPVPLLPLRKISLWKVLPPSRDHSRMEPLSLLEALSVQVSATCAPFSACAARLEGAAGSAGVVTPATLEYRDAP